MIQLLSLRISSLQKNERYTLKIILKNIFEWETPLFEREVLKGGFLLTSSERKPLSHFAGELKTWLSPKV